MNSNTSLPRNIFRFSPSSVLRLSRYKELMPRQLHQSSMKSACLLCSLQRLHDGRLNRLISNFNPQVKAARASAMSAKSAFQILTGLYSSMRRLSSEERLANFSRLSPSRLIYVESPQRNTPFRRPSCQAREEKRKFSPTATSLRRRRQRSRT